MSAKPPVIAVINSSPDVVDMLRIWFETEGFVVAGVQSWELRDGQVDIEAFVRQHDPAVVVYDLAPPYEPNWRLLQHVRGMPALRGREFVLTSTNVQQVARLIAPDEPVLEIIGKPYDLQQLLTAVREAFARRSSRPD